MHDKLTSHTSMALAGGEGSRRRGGEDGVGLIATALGDIVSTPTSAHPFFATDLGQINLLL